jgi:hypothetical protein
MFGFFFGAAALWAGVWFMIWFVGRVNRISASLEQIARRLAALERMASQRGHGEDWR